MKNALVALFVGFLFAIGLGISGMTQTQKVIGFLDFFGNWDSSLIFVMVGGIVVHFISYKLIRKRNLPIYSKCWYVPVKGDITPSLIIGSLIFGIGWGLGGYCPGPAITSLASFELKPLVFVICMILGMILFGQLNKLFKFIK